MASRSPGWSGWAPRAPGRSARAASGAWPARAPSPTLRRHGGRIARRSGPRRRRSPRGRPRPGARAGGRRGSRRRASSGRRARRAAAAHFARSRPALPKTRSGPSRSGMVTPRGPANTRSPRAREARRARPRRRSSERIRRALADVLAGGRAAGTRSPAGPEVRVLRSSVPSAATAMRVEPATTAATGTRSWTSMRSTCGKSLRAETASTAGNGSTAVRRAPSRTCSVVMSRAALSSASRTRCASGPLAPVTLTRSTATSDESRSHSQPTDEQRRGRWRTRRSPAAAGGAGARGRGSCIQRGLRPARRKTLPIRAVALGPWTP